MDGTPIFFFLHIPRTAGTTLNVLLRKSFRPEEIISVYDRADYQTHAAHSAEELRGIRLIQGHLLLQSYTPPLMYGQPVTPFTFLRDPATRLASEYAFLRSWPPNHMYAYLNDRHISFREYIESRERALLYRGKNFMTRCVSGMDTGNRNLPLQALARAKRNLEHIFGFVGIQERFLESLILLGEFMGLENLLHERRNAMKDVARYVPDQEELALIEEYNQGDRELYNFAAALFDERVKARGREFADRLRTLRFLNEKYQKLAGALNESVGGREGDIVLPKDGV
jgi:hypothetical protein